MCVKTLGFAQTHKGMIPLTPLLGFAQTYPCREQERCSSSFPEQQGNPCHSIKGFRGINPCAKVRRCGLFHDSLTPFPLPLAAVGVLTDYDTFASISIFVSV